MIRALSAAMALSLLVACSDTTAPDSRTDATLSVSAQVMPPIATMTVAVSASDLAAPLVFNLQLTNGNATGTLAVRAGTARTFIARAYDDTGLETHTGQATVDVRPGANPPLVITMLPRAGGVPIIITLGSISVTVTPTTEELTVGGTLQMQAAVTDGAGAPVNLVPRWASTNPAVASVSESGLVTAHVAGTARIVATAGGIAAAAEIEVIAAASSYWMLISGGDSHTCALIDNRMICWGSSVFGALGRDTATQSLTPASVSTALLFRGIDVGRDHTCGLTVAAEAYCWGNAEYGRLGLGNPGSMTTAGTPQRVAGDLTMQSLSAGGAHTCGLSSGVAWCWGLNNEGQLGDRTQVNRFDPVRVAGGLTFRQISAGQLHTCGIASSGIAYCWGSNEFGQLGTGTSANASAPTPVAGDVLFDFIEASNLHTCAIATTGAAYCWGSGPGTGLEADVVRSPRAVSGEHSYIALTAGIDHTCGVVTGGAAYCWGAGHTSRLGSNLSGIFLIPVAVPGGHSFAGISAGSHHTCGITTTNRAYCWGYNGYGQLGDGTDSIYAHSGPTEVIRP